MIDPPLEGPPLSRRPVRSRRGPSDGAHRPVIDFDRPFARLAATHALGSAGEAALALALAGSLFFKVDPAAGRQKVLLGLVLTMAPFALVGPLIGPMVDKVRGGHRAVIIGSMSLRVAVGMLMVPTAASGSLWLFPEAFMMLVLAKTYQVAKAAVVPDVVAGDLELVEANSKLQLLGGLSGFVVLAPAGLAVLAGSEWVVVICVLVFAGATYAALQLPKPRAAASPADSDEIDELGSIEVAIEATSMAVIRGLVGFVTLLLAFALRGGAQLEPAENLARNVASTLTRNRQVYIRPVPGEFPKWYFGVVVLMGVVGGLAGASLAPVLRKRFKEERILGGALVLSLLAGVWGVAFAGVVSFGGLALLISIAASGGKQAFDSMIQRDAPDADRGRVFAGFEARFQVAWVFGAVVPAALHLQIGLGAWIVVAIAGLTTVFYVSGGFGVMARFGLTRAQLAERRRDGLKSARRQLSRSGKSGTSKSSDSSGNSEL